MSETSPLSLAAVLKKYDMSFSPRKTRQLEDYCEELWNWNEKINLTRHIDFEKFVTRDVLDSFRLATFLQKGEHILDVGTGGGVPGIILAILRPDLTVELCDSTRKKAEAVGDIIDKLGLGLNVWYAKGEDLVKVHRFHTLVVRAVSKMDKLLEMFAPCWFAFDRLLLIKGPNWVQERGEARHFGRMGSMALRKLDEYTTPGETPEDAHTSVILQVCQKSRLAELQKRDEERIAGVRISDVIESVGVDNSVPRPEKKYGTLRGKNRGEKKQDEQFHGTGRGKSDQKGSTSPRSGKRVSHKPQQDKKG
ncbi:MAG: 16S rRNA (guanine(527)-N(7))-methyltransferase RsmG [Thermoguttaceae bacterium]|nr:16S rRNA (guanine(527)-N(7))-methyltransferase RsmG [Thermoguttaceae bacterium]